MDKDVGNKIKRAAKVIKSGGLVIYPTDTLYGLGCNALDERAVKKVFQVKKRSLAKPLPIAVDSLGTLKKYAFANEKIEAIAKAFLPGGLTLVLKKKGLPEILTSGLEKVAVRIPNNEVALKLIKDAEVPIVTTSANVSEEVPPITVEEVLDQIKDVDIILDGGRLESRIPSTILDLTGRAKILREGKIKRGEIERVLEKVSLRY